MINKYISYIQILLFVSFILIGCSNTKYLKEGEVLYTGASIEIKGKKNESIANEINEVIKPEPNSTAFGLLRIKLWIYNQIEEPKKERT